MLSVGFDLRSLLALEGATGRLILIFYRLYPQSEHAPPKVCAAWHYAWEAPRRPLNGPRCANEDGDKKASAAGWDNETPS